MAANGHGITLPSWQGRSSESEVLGQQSSEEGSELACIGPHEGEDEVLGSPESTPWRLNPSNHHPLVMAPEPVPPAMKRVLEAG